MSGKKPKRSSKNLKINTRIVLTTVLAIAIPLVLVALVCLGLLHSTSHTFQLAAETADRYSLVNQIGWNQTVSNLSDVLLRTKDTDAEKLADITPTPHRWRSGAWRWKFDGVTRYFIEAPGARMCWGVPGRSWPLIRKKMCTTSVRTGW